MSAGKLEPFRPNLSPRPSHALGLGKHGYWRFLRRVYGMGALEAWDYIKARGTPPTAEQVRASIADRKAQEAGRG